MTDQPNPVRLFHGPVLDACIVLDDQGTYWMVPEPMMVAPAIPWGMRVPYPDAPNELMTEFTDPKRLREITEGGGYRLPPTDRQE